MTQNGEDISKMNEKVFYLFKLFELNYQIMSKSIVANISKKVFTIFYKWKKFDGKVLQTSRIRL